MNEVHIEVAKDGFSYEELMETDNREIKRPMKTVEKIFVKCMQLNHVGKSAK